MSLKHLKFAQEVIKFSGGDFTVRGLNIEDIMLVVKRHSAKLNVVFDLFVAKAKDPNGEFEAEEIGNIITPFIDQIPEAACQIIACGAGDPDETDLARQLPLPVQVEALEKILGLTFDAEGGPKKLLETVIRLTQGTTGLLGSLTAGQ